MTAIVSTAAAEYKLGRKQASVAWIAAARIVSLTILLVASAVYEAVHTRALVDANVWLHLRTGLWMLQSHSVPHSSLFSQYSSLPWTDSSWGFDVLLAGAYQVFGLRAIPLMAMLLKLAIAIVTFLIASAGKANFWTAVALSAVAQYVIPMSQSLPYGVSIVFFGVELLLLERSRQSGRARILYWLPALFVVWANLHVLVVSGLMLLGLFLGSNWLQSVLRSSAATWLERDTRPLPWRQAAGVFACSVFATLVNRYTIQLFPTAYQVLYSDVGFQHFAEMHAMSFRRPQEYALMLLVMAAFVALGRRRSLKIFELLALLVGTLVAFRIQREGWMAALPAVAVLSGGLGFCERRWKPSEVRTAAWERPLVTALLAMMLVTAAFRLPHQEALLLRVGETFPVKACDFVRERHLPLPMFHEYSWGSFLTWYLPEYPVAIDSRTELYGDEITEGYFKVIGGGERLETYPALAAAQTLLLQKQSGMVKALSTLPALSSRYKLVYSDDIAAIFVREP